MCRALKYIILVLVLVSSLQKPFAQTTQTIVYTTKEGLPSNSIYRTLLDKQGFLWIATDIGLSRFDGKIFKTYTTGHGLPDNEIVDLLLDSAGIIWAIPFGKSPAYYNLQRDRFENESSDQEIKKIDLGNTHSANVLQKGGVAFGTNKRNLFIYKNKKTTAYKIEGGMKIPPPIKIYELEKNQYLLVCADSFRYLRHDKLITGPAIGETSSQWCERVGNVLYIAQKNTILKIVIGPNGQLQVNRQQHYPFDIRILGFTGKQPTITSVNDITYLLHPQTLELSESISSGANVRNVLQDNHGNRWLSTKESGLIKIQQKRISTFSALPLLQQNFNTLVKQGNYIIAGNNKGEIYSYDGLYGIVKTSLNNATNSDTWVREILIFTKGLYIATQTGSYIFNHNGTHIKQIFLGGINNRSSKAAWLMNDSILFAGTHAMAYKMKTGTFLPVDSMRKRVVSIAGDNSGYIYIGSNDGLYRWEADSLFFFGRTRKGLTYKINTMCSTPDGFMFIGPGSDSLFVLKEKKLVSVLSLGDIIPGNTCKSLYCNKAGEVWLGTNKGLNRLRYQLNTKHELSFSNTFFSIADGLSGEQVNDIFITNDTVYVATNGGISFLPTSMQPPITDITTFITRITINAKDTGVVASYTLPYDKDDITIEFSAVDLTGYYPVFQYSINGGTWFKLERNVIELRKLAAGKSIVRIRALKRDGTASAQVAMVSFYIRTAFWKSGLFWALFLLGMFVVSTFLLQQRNKRKQKAIVEKVLTEKKLSELEMQALKAQINPHFVFNCLNSIKGFIFDKDFKQADKYLDKFSELLRSTLDNSSSALISLQDEIKYLDNYLQLEKLRFDDKFDYFVTIEDTIAPSDIYVPAMLLQPYVENAIRHGIRHLKSRKGNININVKKEAKMLLCEIDDNGIGMEKAMALRNKTHIEYQSRGMQLSKRRAELYDIAQTVIHKRNDDGSASGTTILLKIPFDLKP